MLCAHCKGIIFFWCKAHLRKQSSTGCSGLQERLVEEGKKSEKTCFFEKKSGVISLLWVGAGKQMLVPVQVELINLYLSVPPQGNRTRARGRGEHLCYGTEKRGTEKNGLSWKSSVHFSHSCRLPPPAIATPSLLLCVPRSPASSLPLFPRSGRAFNTCGWKGQLCERPVLSSHPQDASACPVQ